MDKNEKSEIATYIKESVNFLLDSRCGCCTYKLDDNLAICIGWSSGYGSEIRTDVIQDKDDPDWAINVGLKVHTSDSLRTDYDLINFPYHSNGEVLDIGLSIEPDADYLDITEWLLKNYNEISNYEFDDSGKILDKEMT